jgi:putative DNA primase/helicase
VSAPTEPRLDAARKYLARGWQPLPIPLHKKAPAFTDWTSFRVDGNAEEFFSGLGNIGVLLGEPSQRLVDVDLDAPEALTVSTYFLPPTGAVFGRATKPRSHCLYVVETPVSTAKFKDPTRPRDTSMIVELRSTGAQTIFPPSTHPSGELVQWHEAAEPAPVSAEELLRRVRSLAAAALLVRHYPAEGSRNEFALALSGALVRAGWSATDIGKFVRVVAEAAGDEETYDRVRAVKYSEQRIATERPTTGWTRLSELVGTNVVQRLREWLAITEPRQTFSSLDWPDPAPLGDELPPVPAFDLELLPASLRPLVEDLSERMQTPPDYAAADAVVSLAGCVGRRALIQPKVEDTGWRVVPNLWGAIIAPPGLMKSPILRAITLPLTHIEEALRAEYENAKGDFEIEKEQAELRHQAWKENFKSAVKKGEPPPIQPDKSLCAPKQRRLVVNDSTFEKLHEILAQNPAGVLVVRDELTGWLAGLDRLGREGERAFFLEAWNGDSGFTVDRIGRGSIYVPAVCVSLLGNIQPARLRWYLAQALEGGPSDDGLFQRFQVMVWPDSPRDWRLVDRPPNQAALHTAELVFTGLAKQSDDDPILMHFAPDAQELFFAWLSELEKKKVRNSVGIPPVLIGHLSKYRSLMPSLAGLFQLADYVAIGSGLEQGIITLDHARQAAALCDVLESHAHRVYSCPITPQLRAAHELGRHLREGALRSPFTTRVVYLKSWTGLDSPDRARAALELLEEVAWIRQVPNESSAKGGRPSEIWAINPKIGRR